MYTVGQAIRNNVLKFSFFFYFFNLIADKVI